jgi:aspartyl protease family protein
MAAQPVWMGINLLTVNSICASHGLRIKSFSNPACYGHDMLEKTLMNTAIIVAVCIGGVVYLQDRGKNDVVPEAPVVEAPVRTTSAPTPTRSASVVSVPKDRRSGQYMIQGRVDSGSVKFLVDTGASAVALTVEDARKAGIQINTLDYSVPISTAGGRNYAAAVKLKSVSLGGITLRDVDALVVKEGLDISLLGMSYLGRLQRVEATPNALLLRL